MTTFKDTFGKLDEEARKLRKKANEITKKKKEWIKVLAKFVNQDLADRNTDESIYFHIELEFAKDVPTFDITLNEDFMSDDSFTLTEVKKIHKAIGEAIKRYNALKGKSYEELAVLDKL